MEAGTMGYALIQWLLGRLLRACFRLSIIGEEHLPRTGPVILAANHPSQMDPVALGAALPRRVSFLAAAELLTMPMFGALIRPFHPIPVKRGQFDLRAIKECLNRLSRGEALLVFPCRPTD
jgi:1-acyl-sn-glycerol-3-phosphate acyltransferase